ncbi:SRPBCC domain-containing protein [Paenarthrobacter sp. NPDC092416]|uniref:SRPBCC family protein n=1 Tax=Paenarthrobacter sp. NPDC092416 TaxID=3364386 RepID=UPI003807133D
MATFRVTTLVAAPPEHVFAAWTDPDRFPEWIGGVTRVTDRIGSIDQAGSRYTVWFGRMASPTEILAVERPWHLRTRFGNAILKGESDVRFAAEGGGTRINQEFETRGFVSAIFARLFAMGSYRGSFRGELETFRKLVEREASGPGGPKPSGE